GMGGVQALRLLGMKPLSYHMNEGHSAFLGLERIRLAMQENPGLTFQQAQTIMQTSNIFTTHTPVPAGLERFGFDLIDEHFPYMWTALGLTREQFIDLGRENLGSYELFSMAVLALNLSSAANGVSKLHGRVSREMWQWMYPGLPVPEIPIGSVTNGIHVETWTSREIGTLYDRYLDPAWREDPTSERIWADVKRIPDSELWGTHERRRERLVDFCRHRLREQLIARGATQAEIEASDEVLHPEALTIGFARRFATYKRATLIFEDKDRLARILNDPVHPVQLIFAGKAHPHDIPGKEFIREIVALARLPEFRTHVVFIENYDMEIARYLVEGVDVWLNNPRRPKEASGTSGMKVIYNGGLTASTLDGWWDEGYDPSVGWAIGKGEEYIEDQEQLQDQIEAQALYTILEKDIVPLFYERTRDGLPRDWIAKVKNSILKLAPYFNTNRMVMEYTEKYYLPAIERIERLTTPDLSRGLKFAAWRQQLSREWPRVNVVRVKAEGDGTIPIGGDQEVHAWVDLGNLTPDDVSVQVYTGRLDTTDNIVPGTAIEMNPAGTHQGTVWEFVTRVAYKETGKHGISVRVLPCHEDLPLPYQRGLIRWA
ncbi:MAG TPA: alpha-glucan family phosphorylase, partial [Aggregatilineales bacterium]|nr:alpha-glucan family phosphorylase [Aggregatilineales bacterium]